MSKFRRRSAPKKSCVGISALLVVAPLVAAAPTHAAPVKSTKKPAAANPVAAKPASPGTTAKDPFTRGMDLYRAGKLDEALVQFREAETGDPRDPIIQSWLGFIHFKKGRHDDAIRHFRSSISLGPNNPETYNNLGNAYLAKGDTDAAIEAYRQAVELVKDKPGKHADLYYNLGNALVKKGELAAAQEAFVAASQQDPEDPLIQNNLGYVYERMHTQDPATVPIEKAVLHYQRAAEKDPNNAVFQRNLGLAARKQEGKGDLALQALKRAVQLDKGDYNSQLALAEEYQNRGQTAEAVAAYTAAVNLRPKEFIPRYNLGVLQARQANPATPASFSPAVTHLTEAVKLRPTDHRALSALGWVNLSAKRYQEAANWYGKALQAAPDDRALQSTHANLGLVQEQLGNADKAIEHYREAAKLDPTDAATRRLLASAYLNHKQPRYDAAVAEYREIVKLDSKDATSLNNLGFALEKQGKIEEAVTVYKQAIDANPRLAVAHNNLGAAYDRQGQKDLAKQCYQKALQIDPNFADARKNLQQLDKSGSQ